jgi:hypothetical protein
MTASRSTDLELVACSLKQGELADRRARWERLGTRVFAEAVPTDRGLRLVFRPDDGVEDELRELAALERECCAFADWSVSATGGHVVLEVTGSSAEAVAAVQAMFGNLRG